ETGRWPGPCTRARKGRGVRGGCLVTQAGAERSGATREGLAARRTPDARTGRARRGLVLATNPAAARNARAPHAALPHTDAALRGRPPADHGNRARTAAP